MPDPTLTSSPQMAPDYAVYRDNVTAAENAAAVAALPKEKGINMATYENAHIQVIPSGGADPGVTVYWWSDAASQFVQENPTLVKAGVGADVPYEFSVPCQSRRMFVAVSTLAGGAVRIAVAGSRVVTQPVA